MSRIVKVSQSDYRVKVQDSGTITLDTGVNIGTVVITGDLVVQGESTTVNTTNLTIEDNIILLNKGEAGAGITEGTSGIEIARGSLSNAQLLFDEDVNHYDPLTATNKAGTFVLKTVDGALSGLEVNSITTTGGTDLVFDMKNTNRILQVVNSNATAYATRLGTALATVDDTAEDNFIPNKKFILGYIASGSVVPGQADVERIYYAVNGVEKTRAQAKEFTIQFAVNQAQRAQITAAGLDVDDVNLFGHTVSSTSGFNLVLTAANNNVEVNAILNLDDQSGTVNPTGGRTKIYSTATPGPGKSGLFFTNNTTADELVSKNRALLFSMLF